MKNYKYLKQFFFLKKIDNSVIKSFTHSHGLLQFFSLKSSTHRAQILTDLL